MAQLSSRQKLTLRRSVRGMRAALAVSFIVFVLFALFGPTARTIWFSCFYVLLILVAVAGDLSLRRRLKCPQCGQSIGLRCLFGGGETCSTCGTSFI